MSRYSFRLPDLGEGTVCAEIVAWLVKPGDRVVEGQLIADMSTEKTMVEVPSPVSGEVVSLGGAPGDTVAVGAELIMFESDAQAPAPPGSVSTAQTGATVQPSATAQTEAMAQAGEMAQTEAVANHVRASPATRRRALEAGIDLITVPGSGPHGRVLPSDLGLALAERSRADEPTSKSPPPEDAARVPHARDGTEEIKIIGVRRVIAQRMSAAKRTIPHFTYVDEVDVTELEALRQHLNARAQSDQPKLTLLPFIVAALGRALQRFPQCNARYDEARATLVRHRAIHVGIATQTIHGLKVPVVRHVESLSLSALAAEIRRVSEAARNNSARPEDLSGSTITVTSLGKLGGIASTPIINAPEVAIIGVNRMAERVVVYRGAVAVRLIMNLSASFDHRFVDGFDAAAMIQALKQCLEHPATMWLP